MIQLLLQEKGLGYQRYSFTITCVYHILYHALFVYWPSSYDILLACLYDKCVCILLQKFVN